MFVTGVSGTGRETTVKRLLDSTDTTARDLKDICYVHNFENPRCPVAICFPAGDGSRFADALEECVDLLRSNLPAVLRSERTASEKRALLAELQESQKQIMAEMEKEAGEAGFAVVQIPTGPGSFRPDVLPTVEGNPVSFEKLEEMLGAGEITREDLDRYREKHEALFHKLAEAFRKSKGLEIETQNEIEKLYRRLVRPTVDGILARLEEFHQPKVDTYVRAIEGTILEDLRTYVDVEEDEDPFVFFTANLIVDNGEKKGKPVIVEQFPDADSLFGSVERILTEGNRYYTDFRMIRAGSMIEANGGYLIMDAMDVIRQPGLWQMLTQTLRNQTVKISSRDPFRLFPVELHPEPVEVDVKVIMLGPSWLYDILAETDPEFGLLFRIRADFDHRMALSPENLKDFSDVLASIVHSEALPHLSRGAVGAIAEQAVRLTGRRDKISTEFSRVADYVRQSAYWARQEGSGIVQAEHVKKAIDEKRYRISLAEDYAREQIINEVVDIRTEGSAVGQANGLAIYSGVTYSFGLPARLSCQVSVGREGLIDIERESDLSGPMHTKGVLIINGFLRGRYAQDYPLSLSASLCFEQSYGGIDGDSASSTELYVLMSALSGLPLRQDLAITGSVNQHGTVQAIGGVNQKIEGFFDVCNEKGGLTGAQGVLIPATNVDHLQLRPEVIDAVTRGEFAIYPIAHVDQGIELLTGVEAGLRDDSGSYPEGTVNALVDERLRAMAATLREFSVRGRIAGGD